MEHLLAASASFWVDESGVTAIEYGLLAALIVVAIIGGVTAVGDGVFAVYTEWTTAVMNAIN